MGAGVMGAGVRAGVMGAGVRAGVMGAGVRAGVMGAGVVSNYGFNKQIVSGVCTMDTAWSPSTCYKPTLQYDIEYSYNMIYNLFYTNKW